MMESRTLLSGDAFTWVLAGNGSFNVAANWIDSTTGLPGVPGPTAEVNIGQGVVVTISQSTTIDDISSQGVLQITGGTLTVNNQFANSLIGNVQLGGGATLQTTGGSTSIGDNSTYSGTLSTSAGATLNFSAGIQQFNTGTAFAGAGLVDFTGATVSVNASVTAPNNLEMDQGIVQGNGTFTLSKAFNWNSGTFEGGGTMVAPSGTTITFTGPSVKQALEGYTLNLNGTLNWGTSTGQFIVGDTATLNNAGTFNITGNTPSAPMLSGGGNGPGTFNNIGTLNVGVVAAANAIIQDGLALNNAGTVNVLSGKLTDGGGGADTGTFNVAAGATLDLTGETTTIASTAPSGALSGKGTFALDGGNLAVLPSISVANLTVNNGTLTDPGTLTVTGAFNWTGGNLDAVGTTTLGAASTATISGSNNKTLSNGHLLNTQGSTTFSGSGALVVTSDGILNNSGTFAIQGGETITGGSANGTFNNSGTLNIASGIAQSTAVGSGDTLKNSGTLNVTSGILMIGAGGVDTGTLAVSAGAVFDVVGGTVTIVNTAPSTALSGTGTYQVDDTGVLTVGPSLSVANLTISNGTLTNPGTLTVTGAFNWTSGDIDGAGATTLAASATSAWTSANTKLLTNGHVINNLTTTNLSGSGGLEIAQDATINNSGTLTITGSVNVSGDGKGILNNTGTLNAAAGNAGMAVIDAAVNNSGTVNIQSGTLQLADGGTETSKFVTSTGAELALNGGAFLLSGTDVHFSGQGIFALTAGSLGTGNAGGALTVDSGAPFLWSSQFNVPIAATFTFNGTLNLIGTQNEVIGGGGTFQLNGTLNQQATGNLEIDGTSHVTTLVIPSGSTYNIQADSGATGGSGGMIVNQGTIEKTGGAGTSTIATGLTSTAAISVNQGTLILAPPTSSINGGTFTVATGAVLDLTGNQTVNYGGTLTGAGGGQIQLNAGVVQVINGSSGATFNFPNGQFVWTGGTINTNHSNFNIPGARAVKLAANAGLTLTGGGSFNLAGTATDVSNGPLTIQGGTALAVQSGGSLNFQTNAGIQPGTFANGSGVVNVNSGGAVSKTLGTSTTTISVLFANSGTVMVSTGTLNLSGAISEVSGTTLTGGAWNVAAASGFEASLTFGTTSQIATLGVAASVTITGANSSIASLNALSAIKGSFSLLGGKSIATTGALSDAGLITLGAGSTLTVGGAFVEMAAGRIVTQLGGSNAAPTIGSISAKGISLAGSLTVANPASLTPPIGKALTVINNLTKTAVAGTFSGVGNGKSIAVGKMSFTVFYNKGSNNSSVTVTRLS
jgi:hypothetical protein